MRTVLIAASALLLAAGGFVLGTWYGVAQPLPWGLYP